VRGKLLTLSEVEHSILISNKCRRDVHKSVPDLETDIVQWIEATDEIPASVARSGTRIARAGDRARAR